MPHKMDTNTTVYFYEQEFYCLSNFSAFRLHWHTLDFDTAEAAYQWTKFHSIPLESIRLNIQVDIYNARSAHEAFKIAEANRKYAHPCWDKLKIGVMHQILKAKTGQHEYVQRKLLQTGDRVLIEDSWRDNFWGWGATGDGENMLGKLWMEIRNELRT